MRHNKKFNHLGRKSAHRKAMLANMASSLIVHKRITTTLAKAKALRMYVEPLITKSKNDTTHSRRVVFSYLQDKEAVAELFRDVSEKVANRPGGYTRILKTGNRMGDNAEMCIIELVDFNEAMLAAKAEAAAPKKRRSRRGGGGSKTETVAPVAETKKDEAVKAEKSAEKTEPVVEEEMVADAEVVIEEPEAEVEAKTDAEVEAKSSEEEPKAEEPESEEEKKKEE